MEQPIFISYKSTPLDKTPLSTLATVVIPAVIGGGLGAIGLIAGPVGLIAIPLGVFVGMTIGAILTAKVKPL